MEGSHLLAFFHGLLSVFFWGAGGWVKESLSEGLHHAQLQLVSLHSLASPAQEWHRTQWPGLLRSIFRDALQTCPRASLTRRFLSCGVLSTGGCSSVEESRNFVLIFES